MGESGTGKTAIVFREVRDTFSEGRGSYIPAAFMGNDMTVDGATVGTNIWDTPTEKFLNAPNMTHLFCKDSRAAIIVYDITNKSSFDGVPRMIEFLKEFTSPPKVILAVVGNKMDLESQRVVSQEMAEDFVNGLRGEFEEVFCRECSAKTGEGVKQLFEEICRFVIKTDTIEENNNGEDDDDDDDHVSSGRLPRK